MLLDAEFKQKLLEEHAVIRACEPHTSLYPGDVTGAVFWSANFQNARNCRKVVCSERRPTPQADWGDSPTNRGLNR